MSPWIQIQHTIGGEGWWTTASVDQLIRGQGSQETEMEAKSRNHRAGHCMNRGELLVNKCDLLGEKGPLMVVHVHVIDFYHGDAKLACYKIV